MSRFCRTINSSGCRYCRCICLYSGIEKNEKSQMLIERMLMSTEHEHSTCSAIHKVSMILLMFLFRFYYYRYLIQFRNAAMCRIAERERMFALTGSRSRTPVHFEFTNCELVAICVHLSFENRNTLCVSGQVMFAIEPQFDSISLLY